MANLPSGPTPEGIRVWRECQYQRKQTKYECWISPIIGEFTVRITRARLNSGGYDYRGRYFGAGEKLWQYSTDGLPHELDGHVRAPSKALARAALFVRLNAWTGNMGHENRGYVMRAARSKGKV